MKFISIDLKRSGLSDSSLQRTPSWVVLVTVPEDCLFTTETSTKLTIVITFSASLPPDGWVDCYVDRLANCVRGSLGSLILLQFNLDGNLSNGQSPFSNWLNRQGVQSVRQVDATVDRSANL